MTHCESNPLQVSAEDIFLKAQIAWNERAVPQYEAFTLPCALTFLDTKCAPGENVQFIVRLNDGRTFAHTVGAPDAASRVLLRGGYITGPAGAPLGFYRRMPSPGAQQTPAPPNLAADPISPIATVTTVDRAYEIQYVGEVNVDGFLCYHLTLRPLRNAALYPLRDLWVNKADDQIVRLTYAQPYNTSTATVHYDFALAGAPALWTIVHVDASYRSDHVSEDLHDIEFPASEPDTDFDAGQSL